MANRIYRRFVAQCDLGLDFHTSTQNRTTIYHARADLDNPEVRRLARAYATNVVLYGSGDEGSLRSTATADGIPTVTVEMGRAHRFQPVLIEKALEGRERPRRVRAHARRGGPLAGWFQSTAADSTKRWLRADTGGLVEMEGPLPARLRGRDDLHHHEPLQNGGARDRGPFDGLIVGSLENPVAAPGHPLCHVVKLDAETRREIEREIDNGSSTAIAPTATPGPTTNESEIHPTRRVLAGDSRGRGFNPPDGGAERMIEVEGLRKTYGDFAAVVDSTFSVAEGEVFGIVGPNGAGKTTTLKVLAGLVDPSDGEVEVAGFASDDPEMRRQLGFLPRSRPSTRR